MMASPSWTKMSSMKPWLRISATTPNVTAATVVAVRPFWRCTLRQASLRLADRGRRVLRRALVGVSEGIDDAHAGGSPGGVESREECRHDGEGNSICHQPRRDQDACNVA